MKKAIFIDAKKREIREVSLSPDQTLHALQKAVGGFIELVRVDDQNDLYVNEEGLINGTQEFFSFMGAHQPFAGNGVIIGVTVEGESCDTTLTLDQIKGRVKFLTSEEAYYALGD